MALALYRKYRPAKLAEVVGQEHVTDPLATALTAGRINHAYLFSGPRGCGKTSSARILARSLNCVQGPTPDPCGECDSCVALAPEGPGSIDVVELDAASHGGVEDARELRDRAFYAPAESRYRVFIVDEAHMVTTQGFNALLKIVEEPPDHLVFVFATTEPDKVLPTIRSRTHHYPFRLIPPGTMRSLLERICDDEGVTVAPPVYPLVIRAGGGSARDTLSVLDQLLAGAGPEGVTYERAVALLGVTDAALIDDTVDALAAADGAAVYQAVDRLVEAGHDPRRFAADLLQRIRDLMLVQAVPEAASRGLVDGAADELERMTDQAARLGAATLARYGEIVHNGLIEMRGATAPRLLLELLCARMLLPAATTSDAGLLERLERIERRNAIAPDSPVDDGGGRPQFVRASQRGTAEPAAQSPAPSSSAEPRERAAPDTASGRGASDDGPSGSGRTTAGPAAAAAQREQPPEPGPRERRAPEGGGSPSGAASAGDRTGAASPGSATEATGTDPAGPSATPGASPDPATAAPVRTPGQEVSDRLAAAGNAEAATESARPTRSSDADAPDAGEADPSTSGGAGSTVAAGAGSSASGSGDADTASGGAGSTTSAGGAEVTAPVDGGTPRGATGRRDPADAAGHGAGSTTPDNAIGSSDREGPAGQTDRVHRSGPVERGVPGDPTGGEPEAAGSGSESGAATAQPADPASSVGDADRSSAPATGGDAAASSDRDAASGAAGSTSPAGRDGADVAARGEGTAGSADRPGSTSREDPGGPAREGEAVASTGAGAPRPPRDGAPPDSAPPESARPAPAPSSLDAAAVRRVWSEILSAARQRSRSTEALLVNATVRAVDGDTLVLSIGSPPLARRLSEPRNTDVIADALHAVLGVRWTVRCDQGDGPAGARPATTRQESRPRQAPTRRSTQDSGQGSGQGAGESGDGPQARPDSPGRQDATDRSRNGGAQSGRSARPAPDSGEPLPPEPPPDDAPPEADDEESMMAEAAADSATGGTRRDPEVAAMELLSNELGARTLDRG